MGRTALRFSIAACVLAVACATPTVTPVDVQPITPGRGEGVVTDQSILIVDTSGSITRTGQFPDEKALAQSLVAAMPNGRYEAGAIGFGGFEREVHPLAVFDRAALSAWASDLSYLNEGTPLYQVLTEAGAALGGKSDRAAITVVTDGLPTDPGGREVPAERTLEVAGEVAKAYAGKLCIYTLQVGSDPAGGAFLQQLSKVTGCGSHRSASSLTTAAAIQGFQREVYLGAAQAAVAQAMPGDADGDGVRDASDKCPGTPAGARVDARGCWVIEGLTFATNSDQIEPTSAARLQSNVVRVLKDNPDVRIRIDGHTDSRGDEAYNQKLSERRAESVRSYLVRQGIAAARLEARGFGESNPIAPNDTPENLRKNRRTELTALGQ